MGQVGNKLQDQTRTQSNRIKCKWRKYSSEKVETVRLDKKVRPNYTAYKKHSLNVNANSLKGWKKIYCANISQRKGGLAILISKQISEQKLLPGDKFNSRTICT